MNATIIRRTNNSMPYPIIEITQASELFPPLLRAIGEDCPERLGCD